MENHIKTCTCVYPPGNAYECYEGTSWEKETNAAKEKMREQKTKCTHTQNIKEEEEVEDEEEEEQGQA